MNDKCKKKACKMKCVDFWEMLTAAKNMRDMVERLAKERDDLKKDLTLTKIQLEELEKHVDEYGKS